MNWQGVLHLTGTMDRIVEQLREEQEKHNKFIKDIASLLDNDYLRSLDESDESDDEYTCEDILAGIRILKRNKELAQENVLKGYKRYADLVKKNKKN